MAPPTRNQASSIASRQTCLPVQQSAHLKPRRRLAVQHPASSKNATETLAGISQVDLHHVSEMSALGKVIALWLLQLVIKGRA